MDNFRNKNLDLIIPLNIGSLLLIAGAIYVIKNLTLLYGEYLGFVSVYLTTNTPLSTSAQSYALQLSGIHLSIYEGYILFLVALALMGSAFLMYMKRTEKNTNIFSSYTLLHSAFTVVYILLFFISTSSFPATFHDIYIYLIYFGMGLCLVCDIYMEYVMRQPAQPRSTTKQRRSMSMDPSTPFSNIVMLQEELFPKMIGHLRIIDKHFNSVALTNFHRVVDKSITNFTKITILTSKEMLDTGFNSDLTDFRNQLTGAGVGLEVKLMDDKDTIEQHERVLMDDKIAYKIPPFNIINKRSEHITTINFSEAMKRFDYLYHRAQKVENYNIKRARDEKPEPPK